MNDSTTTNIVITGAGGPAAVAVIHSLAKRDVRIFAADMDPLAAGLFLVPKEQRLIVPAGKSPNFSQIVLELSREHQIDVVIPTVDYELESLASDAARFAQSGIDIMLPSLKCLQLTLDKWSLVRAVAGVVPVPLSAPLEMAEDVDFTFPVIVKPRRGSGSRGIELVETRARLRELASTPGMLVQQYLPGAEYSVDVLATCEGQVVATVPRERLKIDSGVAVTSRSVHDEELERLAARVARTIGLRYVANVQFRRDEKGRPCLLEVNPRFPGTMPLTIASGIDMPCLALDTLLGEALPDDVGEFEETAVVRYLEQCFIGVDELDEMKTKAEAIAMREKRAWQSAS